MPFSIPLVNAIFVLLFLGILGVSAHLQKNSPPSPAMQTQENHLIYLKLYITETINLFSKKHFAYLSVACYENYPTTEYKKKWKIKLCDIR